MRHITARFSIWNKLGWFGIICYCLFAMFAPSALSDTNGQIGLILAFMSIALIAFPVRKPYNAVAMVAAAMWLVASQLVPAFEFAERNPRIRPKRMTTRWMTICFAHSSSQGDVPATLERMRRRLRHNDDHAGFARVLPHCNVMATVHGRDLTRAYFLPWRFFATYRNTGKTTNVVVTGMASA